MNDITQGSLFSADFLTESIRNLDEWSDVSEAGLNAAESGLRDIFSAFPHAQLPNESQTEDDLIWPVLGVLGWEASLRQQNLSARGREDVPDGLLFADQAAKSRANEFAEEWRRYEFGLAVVESKRWARPLDRRSGRRGEETAPSTQMLRYLRRVDDLTTGGLRWGILTNGVVWRLYFQGARSVSEQFCEINLATILDIEGYNDGLFALNDGQRRHWLRVFLLIFRQAAFVPHPEDNSTFHQRALNEGRFYEERVAASLSDLVFSRVFPKLVKAIAAADPDAELHVVREAALVFLYRLLFILYAEDRDLLPIRDGRYDDYGLRDRVRIDIGRRLDRNDVFSDTAARYWSAVDDLCRAIDQGDGSIGLPPYNGGLFDRERTPLLADVRLNDQVMADVIDALSFEQTLDGRRFINYRNLGVQQLGSIYERLLEHEIHREDDRIIIRPNIFARKGSGSYYTPDDLVGLIIRETLGPLVSERLDAFISLCAEYEELDRPEDWKLTRLKALDPAEKLLDLKICDPAMGSGHFLVNLVDYLADQVIAAMADAEALFENYMSPLADRVDAIRTKIVANGEANGWTIDAAQLDDRHIIRRMILKRCVYGVDKNPMAVELAKVALWLHTFTVGAPLSFLDHHLICGDSLFGSWVRGGIDSATEHGSPLLLHETIRRATSAAVAMQALESLTDAEIAEAHRSAEIYTEVQEMTAPLNHFLAFVHALDWLDLSDPEDTAAVHAFFDGQFGDPIEIAGGRLEIENGRPEAVRFLSLLERVQVLLADERFFQWQVAFPRVWTDWHSNELVGGFDAVIGNPPWDRMKMQQVEWFAVRRTEIAMAQRAADRRRMIRDLVDADDPLAQDYAVARDRAETAANIARGSGDYPLLSRGDINLYSLFVERAFKLVNSHGVVGLLTPSGIAADKTASVFFKGVATEGRLTALYDFENRRTRYGQPPFFRDIDSRFKFCVLVASREVRGAAARCAFFLQDVSEASDTERSFTLTADDFSKVNPNTGTAPVFRSRRDAEITTGIYDRLPVLVDRSGGGEVRAWPVRYMTMFHMTNDSGLFRTRQELEEEEGAYPIGGNRFGSPAGDWVPLYEGKMVQAYDHRAASVVVNPENQHRPGQPLPATEDEHRDSTWVPTPQFWILEEHGDSSKSGWCLAFKDVTAPTNVRSMIAAMVPTANCGNTLPIIFDQTTIDDRTDASLILGNLNATAFDYCARQKIQGQHLNWYIVEQLPVVPVKQLENEVFGPQSAADIIREAVLELTYTAHDMAPFAVDMGYVDDSGVPLPPFIWNSERRLQLRAKLDALFFILYGVTDRDDVRYIYSTFPIVQREEMAEYGSFRSRELCLAFMNALEAGDPDAHIDI